MKPRIVMCQGICLVVLNHDNEFSEFIDINTVRWQEDGEGFGLE